MCSKGGIGAEILTYCESEPAGVRSNNNLALRSYFEASDNPQHSPSHVQLERDGHCFDYHHLPFYLLLTVHQYLRNAPVTLVCGVLEVLDRILYLRVRVTRASFSSSCRSVRGEVQL